MRQARGEVALITAAWLGASDFKDMGFDDYDYSEDDLDRLERAMRELQEQMSRKAQGRKPHTAAIEPPPEGHVFTAKTITVEFIGSEDYRIIAEEAS